MLHTNSSLTHDSATSKYQLPANISYQLTTFADSHYVRKHSTDSQIEWYATSRHNETLQTRGHNNQTYNNQERIHKNTQQVCLQARCISLPTHRASPQNFSSGAICIAVAHTPKFFSQVRFVYRLVGEPPLGQSSPKWEKSCYAPMPLTTPNFIAVNQMVYDKSVTKNFQTKGKLYIPTILPYGEIKITLTKEPQLHTNDKHCWTDQSMLPLHCQVRQDYWTPGQDHCCSASAAFGRQAATPDDRQLHSYWRYQNHSCQ